jgi:DNA polymerase-3 subunit alpha
LGAVKGTGESAVHAIVTARAARPFTDLFDFCSRVDKRIVNRRSIEALVRAGAFDALGEHRAALLATVGRAMEAAEQAEAAASQASLFGDDPSSAQVLSLVDMPRWDERQRLQEEKLALGFYVSGHPYNVYRKEIGGIVRTRLAELQARNEPALIGGIVVSARIQMTRRGRMAVVLIDDGTAQREVSVFNELFEQHRDALREDRPIVIHGKVQNDEFSGGLRITADTIYDLTALRMRYGREIKLSMNGEANAQRLAQVLGPYRNGPLPVRVLYLRDNALCDARLGDAWKVTPDDTLMAQLSDWLQPENVEIVYG